MLRFLLQISGRTCCAGEITGEVTMKFVLGMVGTCCLWANAAAAQTNSGNLQLLTTPSVKLATAFFADTPSEKAILPGTNEPSALPSDTLGLSAPVPATPAPSSIGVFNEFPMEVYFGYTFYSFHQLPSDTQNLNGFNLSVQYYLNNWLGLDGEFASAWGSQSSHGCFGGGGARARWSAGRGIEVWGHGMFGGSCYNVQTPYGGTTSLAYQVGGGIDIDAHHHRWAYRIAGDMVGTNFYNTHQYSPKISAGIVFKF